MKKSLLPIVISSLSVGAIIGGHIAIRAKEGEKTKDDYTKKDEKRVKDEVQVKEEEQVKDEEKVKDRIGIIGAMDEEVSTLKEAMSDKKTTTIAGMDFCEGKLDGIPVVVVKCGMGKVNAGICAHTLINQFDVSKVINTGVAGSLDAKIEIGRAHV